MWTPDPQEFEGLLMQLAGDPRMQLAAGLRVHRANSTERAEERAEERATHHVFDRLPLLQTRGPSNSRACRWAASLSGLPDSIRLISTIRPSELRAVTSERVRPPASTLRTST